MRDWTRTLLIGVALGATASVATAQPPEGRPPPQPERSGDARGPGDRGPGGGRPPVAQGVQQGRQGGLQRGPGDGPRPFGGNGGPGRGPGFDRGPVVNQFNDRGGYGLGAGGRPAARPDHGPDGRPGGPGGWHDRDGGRDRNGVAVWHGGPPPGAGQPGRGRPDRDWRDGRPAPGGWDRGPDGPRFAGGPGGRPGIDRGRPGGDWNRGWRDDRRYDWQGWRAGHGERFRGRPYRPPYGYGRGYRSYGIGAIMAPAYFAQSYWIADPYSYRLPPAYGPYRWVRYYGDALLIDVYSGRVVDVIPAFFL